VNVVYEPPRVTDLGTIEDLIAERNALKKRVDELQADNTRLLEERRGVDERYMVEHFHRVCDVPVLPEPRVPADERVRLRLNLIAEEFLELLISCFSGFENEANRELYLFELRRLVNDLTEIGQIKVDLPEFADACADLKYVIVGSELEFGIDGRPIFRGVHEANMKKAGGPVREDGKRMKPVGWKAFDVAEELRRQGWRE
jgi:predicted HAD superfamily Cof-like phosphohydrolase